MQKVNRGTDIIFNIDCKDSNGYPMRVKDADEFTFKFYTVGCCCDCCEHEAKETAIEASYKNGELKNIVVGKNVDQIVLEAADVSKLNVGVLRFEYSFKVRDDKFANGYYDESGKGMTDVSLI